MIELLQKYPLLYVALFAGALLVLLVGSVFIYFFSIIARNMWADRQWEKNIVKTAKYKELKQTYIDNGHRDSKAHDLAMRRLHRKAVRKVA